MQRSRRWWIVVGIVGLAAAVGVGVAAATVTSRVQTDTNQVRLKVIRFEFEPSDDQPTFNSGWHTHPGPVIVQVHEGRFKIYQGGCEPFVLRAGETYIEVPEVPALVTAKRHVEWTNSLIRDDAKLDRTDVTSPCP